MTAEILPLKASLNSLNLYNKSFLNYHMKNFFLLILSAIILTGCSNTRNTVNLSPEEHFKYAMELFTDEDYLLAIQEFQAINLQFPASSVADDAQYYLAESHYKKGEYILAAYEFSRLIKDIPASEYVPRSQFMLAESYYQLSPNFQLDQKYSTKAIEEFQAFIDFFPADERVPEAERKISELNDKLAKKVFNTAKIYERMEDINASIYYYDVIIDTYHDSKYAPMAMYEKIKALTVKNDNKSALKEIFTFIERYPGDPNISEVKKIQESLQ